MIDMEIASLRGEMPEPQGTDPVALVGGAASVIAAVVGILLLPVVAAAGFEERRASAEFPPFEYVEARLLKFGEVKDDTRLPDRIVPALPTAPEEVLALDRDADKPEPPQKPEQPEKQADARLDSKLREVFEKARAFAEVQDSYVPEGHPDGVPDGDVTDPRLASLGATYGHRIKRLFLERWVVPTLLGEAQLKKLRAKVNIQVGADMTIAKVEFLDESGNRLFDDTVTNAIERVRVEVRTLPEPPEAIASNIFGGGINLVFNGAEAHYE
jgi:outer membrane biosynthesis protein TonB